MSETRRVELTTAPASQKQRKAARKHVTYRFHLILGESNPETCPEFSFTDFMKNEKPANGDPFEEPDEEKEVAALAQRFEAKYAPKVLQSGKKKRTQEIDDYYDPGGGYDEDDTFIDNTEAYDEIVPSSMTTQCGGFYINQGKLSFRNLNEDPHDFKQAKKRKKTSSLDAENEEEMGTALAKKYKSLKRKKQVDDKEGESKKVKISNGKNSEVNNIKKRIKLKLKKLPPDMPSQKDVTAPSFLPPVAVVSLPATTADSGMVTASGKTVTSTTVNGAAETWAETSGKDELGTLEDIFSAVLRESITDDSSSKSEEEGKGENQMSEKNTQLPPQLPPELLEAIENMKREAKESKEKKLKFFSSYINKLLLDIEIGSHKLPWGQKTAIYNHLGYHLPCGKHTLQRRAKKLRESQEEDQLKEPIQKLREAIMKVMPGLMEQHELHVQKAKMDAEIKEEVADVKEEVSTESEGEEKSDNRKKPRGPRRKFQWNSEIRDLLLSIVATKMKHYSFSKSRNQTAEEYLKAYLDSGIKPIWPQGWMQTRTLFKESKKAHEDITRGTVQHNRQKKVQVGHDVTPSTLETSRPHISRTEDVMEVSSVMETCVGNKDTVIVNLPNSMASLPEMFQTTVHSLMSSSAGHLSKPSFRTNAITSQSNSVLPSSVTTAVSQKGLESPASFSAKNVISANSGPDITKVVSAEKNVTTKSFTPVNYPVTASGSRVPGSSSVAPAAAVFSNTSRSFMEAFDGFLKSSSLKSDLSSLSSDQQSFQKQKVSVLQQKLTIPQQQKLPQGVLNVTNSQQFKAAMRSPSANENKDIPNSSWTNMSSVVPASKSVIPVVISNYTPETQSQKFPAGLKNAQTLQQSQVISYQGHQQAKRPDLVLKNVTQKKQQTVGSSSSSTPIITTSESQLANKTGVTLMNVAMSSQQEVKKREQEQFQIVQNTPGQSNSQIKLGVVTDIPSSAQKLNAKHQIIRTGTVLSAGTLPQFATRSAADFTGWTSAKNAENVNMKQPLLSGKIVSSDASIVRPLQESAQHSKLPGSISSTTTSPSAPQSSGQSSQKMPEENTVLSAYEQIKTQMRQQEEIEGQALKNLAMALQFGGASNAGLFEMEAKTFGHGVKSHHICSDSGDGVAVVGNRVTDISKPHSASQELLRIDTKRQNSQFRVTKTLEDEITPRNNGSNLTSHDHFGRMFHKSEGGEITKSGNDLKGNDKIVQSVQLIKAAENVASCKKSKCATDRLVVEKSSRDIVKIQSTANIARPAKQGHTQVFNRQSLSSDSKCLSNKKNISLSPQKFQQSCHPMPHGNFDSTQGQVKRSSLPHGASGDSVVKEATLQNTKDRISTSFVPSRKNIFTKVEQSVPDFMFSTHMSKAKLSVNTCVKKSDQPADKIIKSAPQGQSLPGQGVMIPDLAVPRRLLCNSRNLMVDKGTAHVGKGASMVGERTVYVGKNTAHVGKRTVHVYQGTSCVGRGPSYVGKGAAHIHKGTSYVGKGAAHIGKETSRVDKEGTTHVGKGTSYICKGTSVIDERTTIKIVAVTSLSPGYIQDSVPACSSHPMKGFVENVQNVQNASTQQMPDLAHKDEVIKDGTEQLSKAGTVDSSKHRGQEGGQDKV